MAQKFGMVVTVIGLGIIAGLSLRIEARNFVLEGIIQRIALSRTYRFDVLPLKLEEYLPVAPPHEGLQTLLIVSDSRSASNAALGGWQTLLKRLEPSMSVEIVLAGADTQGFHQLVAEVRNRGLAHQVATITNSRSFAGKTGLYAPITAVIDSGGRIRMMSAAQLEEAEVSALPALGLGIPSSGPGRRRLLGEPA